MLTLILRHVSRHTWVFYALFNSVKTSPGTAVAGEDYKHFDGDIHFEKNEALQSINIEIVDDFEWEEDEVFFVCLSIPKKEDGSHEKVAVGPIAIQEVTIINDDGMY